MRVKLIDYEPAVTKHLRGSSACIVQMKMIPQFYQNEVVRIDDVL